MIIWRGSCDYILSGWRWLDHPFSTAREIPGKQKLTKRTVDAINASSKAQFFWDTELKGFGLSVTPAGAKSFAAQYRTSGGRAGQVRRMTSGRFGALTVEEARALAEASLDSLDGKKKATTATEYARILKAYVLPALGSAIEWYPEQARERFLSASELRRLGDALITAETKGLPRQFGSGSTNHLRMQAWRRRGVFRRIHAALVQYYRKKRGLSLRWSALDSAMVKAPKGGAMRVPSRRIARSSG